MTRAWPKILEACISKPCKGDHKPSFDLLLELGVRATIHSLFLLGSSVRACQRLLQTQVKRDDWIVETATLARKVPQTGLRGRGMVRPGLGEQKCCLGEQERNVALCPGNKRCCLVQGVEQGTRKAPRRSVHETGFGW